MLRMHGNLGIYLSSNRTSYCSLRYIELHIAFITATLTQSIKHHQNSSSRNLIYIHGVKFFFLYYFLLAEWRTTMHFGTNLIKNSQSISCIDLAGRALYQLHVVYYLKTNIQIDL